MVSLTVNTLCFAYLLFNWGVNQDITVDDLRQLRRGDSVARVSQKLGVLINEPFGKTLPSSITVAMPGVGKFFVAQLRIDLNFDPEKRLSGVHVERAYHIDERHVFVKID